jgi:beta-N-acetylhexosaminidase
LTLGEAERDFFRTADPLGFVLFANNCESPDQIRALTAALKSSVGRDDALVLIDQEGGRVARLKPPHWRGAPAAAVFGTLFERDREGALEAARLNARLLAADLDDIGINVNCAPVLDVPIPGAHDVIGDRAFSASPETVAALGEAFCAGLLEGGVMPVLKHIPGHGRAMSDSHHHLPVVNAPLEELKLRDFLPFKALGAQPFAMAAHVVYEAIDGQAPATLSRAVTDGVIRGEIGFEGVLLSDDLSMEALKGSLAERAEAVLAGGCDVVLHCSGKLDEMEAVAAASGAMSETAMARLARGLGMRRKPEPVNRAIVERRIEGLLGGGKGGA